MCNHSTPWLSEGLSMLLPRLPIERGGRVVRVPNSRQEGPGLYRMKNFNGFQYIDHV